MNRNCNTTTPQCRECLGGLALKGSFRAVSNWDVNCMLPCAELWARQLSPAYRKSQKRNSAENDLPTTPPPAGGAKDPTHRETQRAPLQTTACWGWIHLFNTVNSRRISSSVLFGFFSGGDLKRERLMREATTPASVLGPGAATDTHPTCLPPPSLQTLCPQPVLHWPALLGC